MTQDSPDDQRARNAERRAATRLRIVQGAARALADRGIEACTVQHILEAAKVSRRTYYQFFADKTAVLVAIYEQAVSHLLKRQELVMAKAGEALQRIVDGQGVYLDFASSSGALFRELAREAQRPESPLLELRLAMHETMQQKISAAYAQAEGKALDPLLADSLILFNEAVTVHVLSRGSASIQDIGRAKRLIAETTLRLLRDPPLHS